MAAKDTDDRKDDDQDGAMTLDMSQAAVKKMISEARERGYITYDQLNQVLPPDQVSSDQIEDVMSMPVKVDGDTAAARSAEAAWGRGTPGGGHGLSGIARAGGGGAWGGRGCARGQTRWKLRRPRRGGAAPSGGRGWDAPTTKKALRATV